MTEDVLDLEIEKITHGGLGIGRHQGKVFFVPFVFPGEKVRVRITENKKNYAHCELISVDTPSPERKAPPCPHFTICGGCEFQHVPYGTQLKWKEDLVREILGPLTDNKTQWLETKASPKEYGYRNRISLRSKDDQLGYRRRKSHQLEPINNCLLADQRIQDDFKKLKSKINRTVDEKKVLFYLDEKSEASLVVGKEKNISFSFQQVNTEVNLELQKAVVEIVSTTSSTQQFFDLYGGDGNFTKLVLPEKRFKSYTLVEFNPASTSLFKKYCQDKKIPASIQSIWTTTVSHFLKRFTPGPDSFVLLDPPRAGLEEEVARDLGDSPCRHLIYISCDLMTLKRDLEILLKKSGHITKIQVFDMFPQTHHIETLVEIQR